jgi:hypothetical protein
MEAATLPVPPACRRRAILFPHVHGHHSSPSRPCPCAAAEFRPDGGRALAARADAAFPYHRLSHSPVPARARPSQLPIPSLPLCRRSSRSRACPCAAAAAVGDEAAATEWSGPPRGRTGRRRGPPNGAAVELHLSFPSFISMEPTAPPRRRDLILCLFFHGRRDWGSRPRRRTSGHLGWEHDRDGTRTGRADGRTREGLRKKGEREEGDDT